MHRHNFSAIAAMCAALTALLLAGCFGAGGEAPATVAPSVAATISLRGVCPRVKVYTPAELAALGDAIDRLESSSPIIPAMADYKRMRDQGRACALSAK